MLHTVNKSPFEKNSLDTCLRLAKPGSAILLIEDGVYAAMRGSQAQEKINDAMNQHKLYALGLDLKSRGLDNGKILEGIEIVDYDGFVRLAAENDSVQSWL